MSQPRLDLDLIDSAACLTVQANSLQIGDKYSGWRVIIAIVQGASGLCSCRGTIGQPRLRIEKICVGTRTMRSLWPASVTAQMKEEQWIVLGGGGYP